jgi:hypothetical protein
MRPARLAALLFSITAACGPATPAESPDGEPRTSAPVVVLPRPGVAEFPLSGDFGAELMWSDGADLLVMSGWPRDVTKRLDRSGSALDGRAPDHATDIAGRGVGANADVIIVGTDGETARLRNGAWDFGLAPALDGEGLAAVAFDPSGRALFAGRHRALYIEQGDTWSVHPYPSSGVDAADLVIAADGTAYIIGAHARILAFSAGKFRDVPLSGLTGDAVSEPWELAWLDPGSNQLWVVNREVLMSINIRTGVGAATKLPIFSVEAMAGASTPSGAVLAIAGSSEIVLFDGGMFDKVIDSPKIVRSLAIDAEHAVLHVGAGNGLFHLPLKHPAFSAPHERRTPQ